MVNFITFTASAQKILDITLYIQLHEFVCCKELYAVSQKN